MSHHELLSRLRTVTSDPLVSAYYLLVTHTDRYPLITRAGLADHASRRWDIEPERPVELSSQSGYHVPGRIQEQAGEHTLPASFVCELPSARLVGPDAVGFCDGSIILPTTQDSDRTVDTVAGRWNIAENLAQIRNRQSMSRDVSSVDHGFSLVSNWSKRYFHWMVDCLPRLQYLETARSTMDADIEVLVPPEPPGWLLESLSLMGYSKANITIWDPTISVDQVYVSTLPREGDIPDGDALRWTRERLRTNADEESVEDGSDRIYISRKKARARDVLTEQRLLDELRPLGFRSYTLEDLSVEEQIALFRDAEFVVGPHGAGFTNIMFSDDVGVVELFGKSVNSTCYFALSEQFGFDYDAVSCEFRGNDIIADPKEVRTVVEEHL